MAEAADEPVVKVAAPSAQGTAGPEGAIPQDDAPRWAGSSIGLSHFAQIAPTLGLEPDWNPTIGQILSFDGRWLYTPRLALAAHAEVVTELTNSDVTVRQRQPLLGDIWVAASHPLEAKLPWDLAGTLSLRVTFPTSKESRARERLFSLRPRFDVTKEYVLSPKVRMRPRAGLALSYTAATSRTLTYEAPEILTCNAEGGDCAEYMMSGSRSAIGGLLEVLAADFLLPHNLVATAEIDWMQSLLYPVADYTLPAGDVLESGDDNTNWRLAVAYLFAITWRPTPMWDLGAGLQTTNPLQGPDGGLYFPLINRFTQVFVSTAVVF